MTAKFPLGRVVCTPAAMMSMVAQEIAPVDLLRRHSSGDWGDSLDAEDCQTNDDAVLHGGRLLSSYGQGERRIWVLTEANRSSTCILLPDDY